MNGCAVLVFRPAVLDDWVPNTQRAVMPRMHRASLSQSHVNDDRLERIELLPVVGGRIDMTGRRGGMARRRVGDYRADRRR